MFLFVKTDFQIASWSSWTMFALPQIWPIKTTVGTISVGRALLFALLETPWSCSKTHIYKAFLHPELNAKFRCEQYFTASRLTWKTSLARRAGQLLLNVIVYQMFILHRDIYCFDNFLYKSTFSYGCHLNKCFDGTAKVLTRWRAEKARVIKTQQIFRNVLQNVILDVNRLIFSGSSNTYLKMDFSFLTFSDIEDPWLLECYRGDWLAVQTLVKTLAYVTRKAIISGSFG